MLTEHRILALLKEVRYKTSRSGGKGGQNVNKVESKVELLFDLSASEVLHSNEKEIILKKTATDEEEPIIKIVSERYRSQLENKEDARRKLISLLNKFLKPVKKRKATKPSLSSKTKRLDSKKKHSQKKLYRKKDF